MIDTVLSVGDKIELRALEARFADDLNMSGDDANKVFNSQIHDIVNGSKLKISMPMESGKIIPLSVNSRYDACFYTYKGLYECRVLITDRYKDRNLFILVVEMVTDLKKLQRRQYYRLTCALRIKYAVLDKSTTAQNDGGDVNKLQLTDGVVTDISGGGLKFVSSNQHKKGDEVYIELKINVNGSEKTYGLTGKILSSGEIKNRQGRYEHRAQYVNIKAPVREEIIKYIFEEERRRRRRNS